MYPYLRLEVSSRPLSSRYDHIWHSVSKLGGTARIPLPHSVLKYGGGWGGEQDFYIIILHFTFPQHLLIFQKVLSVLLQFTAVFGFKNSVTPSMHICIMIRLSSHAG